MDAWVGLRAPRENLRQRLADVGHLGDLARPEATGADVDTAR
jgi:hypothetical protein